MADFGSSFPKLVFVERARCVFAQVCSHVSGHAFSARLSSSHTKKPYFYVFLFESMVFFLCGMLRRRKNTSRMHPPRSPRENSG